MKYTWIGLLLFSLQAWAEVTPVHGPYDDRVRVVDYNPLQVVRLNTFYGVSTSVQFGRDETIQDIAVGDDQAWNIIPRGSRLFIKPRDKKADTNMTVVTDKYVYHFALTVEPRSINDETAWRDSNLVYGLIFRHPQEEAAKLAARMAAAAKEQEAEERRERMHAKLQAATRESRPAAEVAGERHAALPSAGIEGANYDYWVAGSPEISPTAARDDGRFTYLTFTNNRDMPAVYSVGTDGEEALINTSVEGNTIIIHRVVPGLTLRKGDAVACVRNNAFDWDGGRDNISGTIAPDVERVIKEPR
jgi:P-type conjugative transfer protein VirB9